MVRELNLPIRNTPKFLTGNLLKSEKHPPRFTRRVVLKDDIEETRAVLRDPFSDPEMYGKISGVRSHWELIERILLEDH